MDIETEAVTTDNPLEWGVREVWRGPREGAVAGAAGQVVAQWKARGVTCIECNGNRRNGGGRILVDDNFRIICKSLKMDTVADRFVVPEGVNVITKSDLSND